jgi:hypothetical protein
MAKTLRTSGDYTIKTGSGSGGSKSVILDSKTTRVKGDLVVDGSQVIVNTETLSIEDPMIVLSRNTSSTVLDEWDSGILVNRGESSNNASLYWDGTDDVWKAMLTTSDGSGTEITETALAQIQVADISGGDSGFTVANKNYVDAQIVGASGITSFDIVGDDSTGINVQDGDDIMFNGGSNLNVVVTDSPGTVAVSLNQNLTDINSVSTGSSDGDLTVQANGAGAIVVDNILTFNSAASDPMGTPTTTKIYHKTVGGGDTGIYFKNPNDTVGELISKSKATALAIALG